MTAEGLSALAGLVLSLGFSYMPGLRDRFNGLSPEWKRSSMALLLLGLTLVVFGLSCADISTWLTCDKDGAIGAFTIFIAALMANQTTFLISPKLANGEGVRQLVGRMKNGAARS